MNLIDKEGRLFGKINVFDIAVVCLLTLAAFFGYLWTQKAEDPKVVTVKGKYRRFIGKTWLPAYVAQYVSEGEKMLGANGLAVSKIVKIISAESADVSRKEVVYFSDSGKKLVQRPHSLILSSQEGDEVFFKSEESRGEDETIYITMVIELLTYDKDGTIYLYATKTPLKIGTHVSFVGEKYTTNVFIREFLKGERIIGSIQ